MLRQNVRRVDSKRRQKLVIEPICMYDFGIGFDFTGIPITQVHKSSGLQVLHDRPEKKEWLPYVVERGIDRQYCRFLLPEMRLILCQAGTNGSFYFYIFSSL